MEQKEVLNSSVVTLKGDEASQGYRVEPRVENSGQFGGSSAREMAGTPVSVTATTTVAKKRGRPKKNAADGSVVALSPMPISASIPLAGDGYSARKHGSGKPKTDSFKKKHKLEYGTPGQTVAYSGGGSFTPHVITVNTGEDIMMKIISFSQQGSRAICVLAANGTISNVTLRQPNSSGGTLTYEGRFEILSLTGSFMLSDNGLTKSRSGGMSVSLAGPDGRVLGGGLAGMLVAAGPVQVVIGSFVPENQQPEQKPNKPKYEHNLAFAPIPATLVSEQRYQPAAAYTEQTKPHFTTSSFHKDTNLASINSMNGSVIAATGNNVLLRGQDSREPSHELAC